MVFIITQRDYDPTNLLLSTSLSHYAALWYLCSTYAVRCSDVEYVYLPCAYAISSNAPNKMLETKVELRVRTKILLWKNLYKECQRFIGWKENAKLSPDDFDRMDLEGRGEREGGGLVSVKCSSYLRYVLFVAPKIVLRFNEIIINETKPTHTQKKKEKCTIQRISACRIWWWWWWWYTPYNYHRSFNLECMFPMRWIKMFGKVYLIHTHPSMLCRTTKVFGFSFARRSSGVPCI